MFSSKKSSERSSRRENDADYRMAAEMSSLRIGSSRSDHERGHGQHSRSTIDKRESRSDPRSTHRTRESRDELRTSDYPREHRSDSRNTTLRRTEKEDPRAADYSRERRSGSRSTHHSKDPRNEPRSTHYPREHRSTTRSGYDIGDEGDYKETYSSRNYEKDGVREVPAKGKRKSIQRTGPVKAAGKDTGKKEAEKNKRAPAKKTIEGPPSQKSARRTGIPSRPTTKSETSSSSFTTPLRNPVAPITGHCSSKETTVIWES
jgi:hypothetical protein